MEITSKILSTIVRKGIVPPQISPIEQIYLSRASPASQVAHNELIDLAQDDRTARMIEHGYTTDNPGRTGDPVLWDVGDFYELARLVIPHGHFAFLRRIETAFLFPDGGEPVNDWENPDINPNLGSFSFHPRIEPLRGAELGERIYGTAVWPSPYMSFLPGVPWHEMQPWFDYRYPWGALSDTVQLPIRQDAVLRLFMVCEGGPSGEPEGYLFGGRLRASIQSMDSLSAKWMAARQWSSR